MPRKHHPLRPAEGYILVCEGESDYQFLSGVLNNYAPDIYIAYADGVNNVNALRNILSPAVSIKDRDFMMSHEVARDSLKPGKTSTFWPRFDIEGYLLYEDWLYAAIQTIHDSPRFSHTPIPAAVNEIRANILDLAHRLVLPHAGSQTVARFNWYSVGPEYEFRVSKPTNPDNLNTDEWRDHLANEIERIRNKGATLANLDISLTLDVFDENFEQYQLWATEVDTVRLHFSSKQLFNLLAQHWQAETGGAKYSGETLRNQTMTKAVDYSRTIASNLSNDSRLGDMGTLIHKITGRTV